MFSESKCGPLISFSWPLLKLNPEISPGCYGLRSPLITVVMSSLWREGKGWGLGDGWGTTQAEMTPSCQLLRCKEKQAEALYFHRKSCHVTITSFINPKVDLSLAVRVCSSLIKVLMGHRAIPGGAKLYSSVGGQSPKKNSLNVGFTLKYVAWNTNP